MIFTVSQINEYIKKVISQDLFLQDIYISGEIRNLRKYNTTYYFTLSDTISSIQCVIFDNQNYLNIYNLDNGSKVDAKGYISVYTKNGNYQFYINTISPKGKGKFELEFNRIKNMLDTQGFTDKSNKKKLPEYVKGIGVITSEQGSVIHDILNVSKIRNPNIPIYLFPCKVQGEDSVYRIMEGIEFFNNFSDVDVIIICRGGGSYEMLNLYNNENLAFKILKSTKPIVSAIGHETDFTICDYVSDVRASTPSHAAELVIFNIFDHKDKLSIILKKINYLLKNYYLYYFNRLRNCEYKLNLNSPYKKLDTYLYKINNIKHRISSYYNHYFEYNMLKINNFYSKIQLNDINNVLSNGYLYITDKNNNIILLDDIIENDILYINNKNYRIKIKVLEKNKNEKED